VAYRFEQGECSLVLSGDCDYDPGIIAFSRGAKVLVVDCSFPHALKAEGHLSGMECGQVAAGADVGHLILSHLYPVPQGKDTRLQEARTAFPGKVQLAEDLMQIDL
jgi:ribonuclease BN (tRNA processing enzyme)